MAGYAAPTKQAPQHSEHAFPSADASSDQQDFGSNADLLAESAAASGAGDADTPLLDAAGGGHGAALPGDGDDVSVHAFAPAPPGWDARVVARIPSSSVSPDDPGHTYHVLDDDVVVATTTPAQIKGKAAALAVLEAKKKGQDTTLKQHLEALSALPAILNAAMTALAGDDYELFRTRMSAAVQIATKPLTLMKTDRAVLQFERAQNRQAAALRKIWNTGIGKARYRSGPLRLKRAPPLEKQQDLRDWIAQRFGDVSSEVSDWDRRNDDLVPPARDPSRDSPLFRPQPTNQPQAPGGRPADRGAPVRSRHGTPTKPTGPTPPGVAAPKRAPGSKAAQPDQNWDERLLARTEKCPISIEFKWGLFRLAGSAGIDISVKKSGAVAGSGWVAATLNFGFKGGIELQLSLAKSLAVSGSTTADGWRADGTASTSSQLRLNIGGGEAQLRAVLAEFPKIAETFGKPAVTVRIWRDSRGLHTDFDMLADFVRLVNQVQAMVDANPRRLERLNKSARPSERMEPIPDGGPPTDADRRTIENAGKGVCKDGNTRQYHRSKGTACR